ncbi:hypothetical protein L596_013138 [Steinernema carpocapsae]|uniref:SHSP domain-containing protein n=1 Tax=Steinernema carpocapsae TaxID=34508 RepID=A0A4U5P036_STECR|nr:hypothetical protein L596_013138 [Steinernema carpocapsae]
MVDIKLVFMSRLRIVPVFFCCNAHRAFLLLIWLGKKRVRSLSCAGKPDWIVSSLDENSFARMKYTESGFTAKINLECFHPTYNPEEVFVDVADNELQINARKEDPADP